MRARLEAALGLPVVGLEDIPGGCIAQARRVHLGDGTSVFVKTAEGGPFLEEARGLQALRDAGALRVPEVLFAQADLLVLEWIPQAPRSPRYMEELGRGLAALHEVTQDYFGFEQDNFLGATPQPNGGQARLDDWPSFFWQYRLLWQLELAEQKGLSSPTLRRLIGQLEGRIDDLLASSPEAPALIHGDLWSGNAITDAHGAPCLIDPAVYFAHREAELGMMKLFGGFSQACYTAYDEAFPLQPGAEERVALYQLYHVLNHLNLFGHGYHPQAVSLLKQLV